MNKAERLRELEAANEQLRAENAQLRAENAEWRAANAQLHAHMEQMQARLNALEKRVVQDSRNSHKPPASDGLARRPRPVRGKSQRPNGGQIGHPGQTLELVAMPDEVVLQRPTTCGQCGEDLTDQPGRIGERRQVFDLPPVRMQVTEHQQIHVTCPQCQRDTMGTFPAEVSGRAQYGPHLRALAVYLRMQHLLPVERTAEVLEALTGMPIAEASLLSWEHQASEAVRPAIEAVRDALRGVDVLHTDETGIRIGPALRWMHVHSTEHLTLLGWHRQRGKDGIAALGVLEHFLGTAVHDRWASYWQFACGHALCHAHLQRDLQAVIEETGATWAQELKSLFLAMHQTQEEGRESGGISPEERARGEAAFWRLIAVGVQQHPRRLQGKQSAAYKLVQALWTLSDEVLAFWQDARVPFTNNQGERDLRMVKVQQKIAGCWRTDEGATVFGRLRSAISCLHKQGRDVLATLGDILAGRPHSLLPFYG